MTVTRNLLRGLGAMLMTALVIFSLSPVRPHATLHGTAGHLVLHVTLFGLAALVPLLLSTSPAQQWLRASFVFGLALAIEGGQCIVFHQKMEWIDVLLDALGILVAFLLVRFGHVITRNPA